VSRGVRPARPFVPIGSAVLIVLGWFLVAHNSGDGWVQAIGDAVFALLTVGILGPALVLRRARLRVIGGEVDGTAGRPLALQIQASSRIRVRPVEPSGLECFAGAIGPQRHSTFSSGETVQLLPSHRGILESVTVDIATAAPFGLQWWTRRVALSLPAVVHIAPRRSRPDDSNPDDQEMEGQSTHTVAGHSGAPAGVRPYKPGDSRSHVHWPATAHNRDLMVKEMEIPAAPAVRMAVRLPMDPVEAERMAESAMATVAKLLDAGAPVQMWTMERQGAVDGPVEHILAAGRRLARAVPAADRPGVEVAPWA
jgi:uncharacterized protein (DUF58 family)